MEITLTPRHREVLNLIAQGDEIILNIEPDIVKELRLAGFITRVFKDDKFDYSISEKGYRELESISQ